LKELKNLRELNISNTNIDLGLEELPENIELYCDARDIGQGKPGCAKIKEKWENDEDIVARLLHKVQVPNNRTSIIFKQGEYEELRKKIG